MHNERLRELFLGIIENQLAADNPPYVKLTLARLVKEGCTEQEAKTMIAGVIAYHMSNMIHDNHAFDSDEYQRLLEKLPDFPDPS